MFRQLTPNNVQEKCVRTVRDRLAASSADEFWEARTNYRGSAVKNGTQSPTMCMCFVFISSIVFCPLYKLTLSAQAEVILQLRGSLSSLVKRLLVGPPLPVAPNTLSVAVPVAPNTLSVAVAPINQVTAS